ncbi:MAG: phosphoribosylamine--glycine ligase, partial [Pyrinomonadaceae bacterium]
AELKRRGLTFRGALYAGLMLTPQGPKVLEFNVRLGDPEAQAILVRLNSDLGAIFEAVARGRLGGVRADWSDEASACVVLASRGYPESPQTGDAIKGLDEAPSDPHVHIFHAGTRRDPTGAWRTAGGRVVGVTATGATLERALARCYAAAGRISWDGLHYRRDIGKPA